MRRWVDSVNVNMRERRRKCGLCGDKPGLCGGQIRAAWRQLAIRTSTPRRTGKRWVEGECEEVSNLIPVSLETGAECSCTAHPSSTQKAARTSREDAEDRDDDDAMLLFYCYTDDNRWYELAKIVAARYSLSERSTGLISTVLVVNVPGAGQSSWFDHRHRW